MWFSGSGANYIGKITPFGQVTVFPIPTPNSGPRGLIGTQDGSIWFCEQTANNIGRLTTQGTIIEFRVPTANSLPSLINVGADLSLYFTEQGANQIGRITPEGQITEFVVPTPAGSTPRHITLAPDGSIWIGTSTSYLLRMRMLFCWQYVIKLSLM